jgi:hypothetical protein
VEKLKNLTTAIHNRESEILADQAVGDTFIKRCNPPSKDVIQLKIFSDNFELISLCGLVELASDGKRSFAEYRSGPFFRKLPQQHPAFLTFAEMFGLTFILNNGFGA